MQKMQSSHCGVVGSKVASLSILGDIYVFPEVDHYLFVYQNLGVFSYFFAFLHVFSLFEQKDVKILF